MSGARHLQVVDTDTGEAFDHCPECGELKRELARMRSIVASLREDKEAEARRHELWPQALALFNEWRIATGKLKSRWGGQRFWLVHPYLATDGFVICRWAVWGVGFQPNSKRLPSGLTEVYNDWELCFRNRGNFERYARRGYMNPAARNQFSLRAQGLGPDGTIDPNKHFDK